MTNAKRTIVRPGLWPFFFFFFLFFFGVEATAWADLTFYAMSNSDFGTLDVKTGAYTKVGTLSQIGTGDLARLPGGTLYGQEADQTLVTIDPVLVKTTTIGNTGNLILVITFRKDGTLFGASYTDLYTIDPTTAQATHIGTMGTFPAGFYDLTFDDNDNLFLVEGTPSALYKVDSTTGVATMIGPVGFEVAAANFQNGTLYGFTTNSEIISIDPMTGAGSVLIAESMAVSAVAAAGAAADGGVPANDAGGTDGGGGGTDGGTHDSGLTPPTEGGVDGGVELDGSAGNVDGGSGGNSPAHSGSSGCSCRVAGAAGRPQIPASALVAVGGLVGLLRRGRRRPRAT